MDLNNTSTDRARQLEEGATLNQGRFEILGYVAEGGMGYIYRAVELPDRDAVAVKVMRDELSDDPMCVKRFQREAKAVSRLSHPNTIGFLDFGLDDDLGLMYLVMEWLEGADLSEHIREHGALNPEHAAHYAYQVAISLAEAHDKGIVHRDLKPENIFLLKTDEEMHAIRVLDFGIAKMIDEPAQTQITRIGMVCGTPEFMSPEQARGEELDGRSDIYALGCVLYTLLSGAPPFEADNPLHVIMRHQLEPIPPLSEDIPLSMRRIVERCIAKEPDARFSDAHAVANALRAFLDGVELDEDLGEASTLVMEQLSPEFIEADDPEDKALAHGETQDMPRVEAESPQVAQDGGGLATVTLSAPSEGRASKAPLLVILVLALVIGGVIAVLIMQRDDGSEPPAAPPEATSGEGVTRAPPSTASSVTLSVDPEGVPGVVILSPEGRALGAPPRTLDFEGAHEGVYEIIADGYKTERVTVSLEAGQQREIVVALTAQDDRASCAITTEPEGARVLWRGEDLGPSPVQIEVPLGEQGTLKVEHPGFTSATRALLGRADCQEHLVLQPASEDVPKDAPTPPREPEDEPTTPDPAPEDDDTTIKPFD